MEENKHEHLPYADEQPILPEDFSPQAQRDYGAEFQTLMAEHPQLRETALSEAAFLAYLEGGGVEQLGAPADKAQQVKQQNEAAAAKAPVRRMSVGGGTDVAPQDDFLQGFESAWQ